MNKQILVPLDGSALSETSLPHAVSLAHATSSALLLLRSITPMNLTLPMGGAFPTSPDLWQGVSEEQALVREYLAGIAKRLQSDEKGLVVETQALDGDPATVIVHYAEQNPGVKLIAMATHGRSGLSRLVFGSVAEKVLHASPVPLLLVRSEYEEGVSPKPASPKYDKVLVPLDGSEFAEQALDQAAMIAANTGATLLLLTVEPPLHDSVLNETSSGVEWVPASWERKRAEEYLDRTVQHLRHTHPAHLAVETQVSFGEPAQEILNVCALDGVDMIVMSTHGRSGLQRMWLGSVAMKVVRGAPLPVLLVRSKERVQVAEEQHAAITLGHRTAV